MGVESFYVHLTIDGLKDDPFPILFKQEPHFKKAFSYFWNEEYFSEGRNTVSLIAAKVCFFPSCELLFRLCSLLKEKATEIHVEIHGETRKFDFESFIDFFTWVYSCWKDSIENFQQDWGAFLISPSQYYRSRFLLKKYYVKF